MSRRLISIRTTVERVVTNDDLVAEVAAGGPAASAPLAVWWPVTYAGGLAVGLGRDQAANPVDARIGDGGGRIARQGQPPAAQGGRR